jgi:predicted ATP-grasp superfamily ATP-dependent carboligase
MGRDPEGYLDFILALLRRRRVDVLIPIHDQGYLFAKVRSRLEPLVATALPSFEDYERAVSKASFSLLLAELGLPQPATRLLEGIEEFQAVASFPLVLKTGIGTASRGVWMIGDRAALLRAIEEIERAGAFGQPILVQEIVEGDIEHAQAVYSHGRMVAMHGFRQLKRGAGGGDALKESIVRPEVHSHLAAIGERLAWHGALSVDYIVGDAGPFYIDCNPRLVEPMSALMAGVDLAGALLKVSLGQPVEQVPLAPTGVRTHLALQALMGLGLHGASRSTILEECGRLIARREDYAGSREELTPVRLDWMGAIPLLIVATSLIANPRSARALATKGWGAHLLTLEAMRRIRGWTGDL